MVVNVVVGPGVVLSTVVMADTVQLAKISRISLTRLILSTVGRMPSALDAWCRQMGCKLGSLLLSSGVMATAAAAATAAAVGLAGAAPALAIPEADAIKKLQVVPVFVITDSNGVPLPIPRQTSLVLPLYLESAKANKSSPPCSRATHSSRPVWWRFP